MVGRAGASGTLPFEILPGRLAIRFLGSVSTRLLPIRPRPPLLPPLPLHRHHGRRCRPKKKKATDDAEAAAAAAALAWPTEGYDLFIPRLLVHVLAVYMLFIDVSVLCIVHAHMLRYRYEMHTVFVMLIIYSWIRLVEKVLIFPPQRLLLQVTYH